MGTSQSSKGPGPGVPMVPPWTPGVPPNDQPAPPPEGDAAPPQQPVSPIAPSGRFSAARRGLGQFARTGDREGLANGLKNYVSKGYGGSGTATRRFGGTITAASSLGSVLANFAAGQPAMPGSAVSPGVLAGRTVDEIIGVIVEVVRPIDGTQDAEAERAALLDSMSELLERYPEADLLNLSDEQREFTIEKFAAIDVCRRFELDVGKAIIDSAPNAATALSRIKEARDYIKQSVSAAFRRVRESGRALTGEHVGQFVRDALREAFEVFEGYTR